MKILTIEQRKELQTISFVDWIQIMVYLRQKYVNHKNRSHTYFMFNEMTLEHADKEGAD